MPLVNASAINLDIVVDGVGSLQRELINFECGYQMLDEGGIVGFEGSATFKDTLQTPPGFLDDRGGKYAKYTLVTVNNNNIPFKKLRIREANYSPKTKELRITFSDIVSLLLREDLNSTKTNNCPGKPERVYSLIQGILNEFLLTLIGDKIPGWVILPQEGGNPLKICGELAFCAGYFLLVTKEEQVEARRITLNNQRGVAIGLDTLIDYDRSGSGEVPPQELKVNGKVFSVQETRENGGTTITVTETEELTLWSKEVITDSYKSFESVVKEPADKAIPYLENKPFRIISEHKIDYSEYETGQILLLNNSDPDCNPKERKLIRRVVEIWQPYGKVLNTWVTLHKLTTNKNITYTDLFGLTRTVYPPHFSMILASRETWEYDYTGAYKSRVLGKVEDTSSNKNPVETQKIIYTKVEPQAKIFAKPFQLSGVLNADPTFIVLSADTIENWTKRGEFYTHRTVERQAFPTANSQAADQLFEQDKKANRFRSSYIFLTLTKDETVTSNSGAAQPPAPETIKPRYTIKTEEKSFEISVRSSVLGTVIINSKKYEIIPKSITVPYAIASSPAIFDEIAATKDRAEKALETFKAQAELYAKNVMALQWGRYKGVEITVAVTSNLNSAKYTPFKGFTVVERRVAYSYLMDAVTVAYAYNRCMLRAKGLMVSLRR